MQTFKLTATPCFTPLFSLGLCVFVSERCLDMYGTNGHLFRQVTETPQGSNPREYPWQSDRRGEALSTFSVCYKVKVSLLLFETYANVSSQICPFLALQPEFHSNHCVNWSTPRYCQSATFGRLTFCVYTLLFYGIRV